MRKAGRSSRRTLVTGLVVLMASIGCDVAEPAQAPYEGDRPLIIQRLTQSFSPDVQWVGGRVAAVGINRGERAALDSTLVWMHSAAGNDLDSPVYVREMLDADAVMKAGGTPTDSLPDGATFTLWLAEQSALGAALQGDGVDEFSFADTTFAASYLLNGRSGGGAEVDFTIYRDERLTSDKFVVTWTPSMTLFRQLAIRHATLGGYADLLWHLVTPEDRRADIGPPLIIGQPPEGAVVATPWVGFGAGNHVLWAATDEWNGESFGFRTDGYAFFQIFAGNFE